MKREYRTLRCSELRAKKDGKPGIEGYAAVFNQRSENLGGFREVIVPGAFSRALQEDQDVRALVNHDPSRILGRTKSGTLQLSEDKKGLFFSVDLPDTQHARDLMASIGRGDVDQCSFGFMARKQKWGEEPDPDDDSRQIAIRELHDVDLFDVSAVTYPAYPQTSVDARALFPDGVPDDVRDHVKQDENRDSGKESRKTKSVDGVDLTSDCFAYVGDPDDTSTWKLPIKFPGDAEKTKSHIRNALARFGQTKGIPSDKKAGVWKKIVAAAKKAGIKVSDENSLRAMRYIERDSKDGDADSPDTTDGDDDENDMDEQCSCRCESCSNGMCENCSNDDCSGEEMNCMHGGDRCARGADVVSEDERQRLVAMCDVAAVD